MKKINLMIMLLALGCFPMTLYCQQEDSEPDHSYKPLQVNLDQEGGKYIRFIT
jgi:hypothetical protein